MNPQQHIYRVEELAGQRWGIVIDRIICAGCGAYILHDAGIHEYVMEGKMNHRLQDCAGPVRFVDRMVHW